MLQTSPPELEIQTLTSFRDIDAKEWAQLSRGDFPFADLEFFRALEEGGCLGKRTGCYPQILLLREGGRLNGALLLFLKLNSYGEYIFDWSWANASERSGLPYYPKLTALVPFVPATGPKFLIHPEADASAVRVKLNEAARALVPKVGAHSLHYLFTTESETTELATQGLIARDSFQYHWRNRGWRTFDDFLAALVSKRRKEIRREREAVRKLPLRFEALTGDALTAQHAEWMFAFYSLTVHKMGGHPYLTAEFFSQLFRTMKDRVLLFMAFDESGEPVAAALNLFEGRTLFGRHWGCREDYRNLHFELCYYQAIDWAIARGFELFEAGAQGEHKFTRGFSPSVTRSLHWLEHAGLRQAIGDFIEQERDSVADLFAEYAAHDPYKTLTNEETSR